MADQVGTDRPRKIAWPAWARIDRGTEPRGEDVGDVGDGRGRAPGKRGGGPSLVHKIDRLVGEAPGREVAPGEIDTGAEGALPVANPVMGAIAADEPLEDREGGGGVGLLDLDRLEPTLQGRVRLDELAVLGTGGRPEATQLATREGGLEEVCEVVALALGPASRPDDLVELVDEQDGLAVSERLEDRLHPLLEVAPEASSRDEGRRHEARDAHTHE